jgi:hypothetical protein
MKKNIEILFCIVLLSNFAHSAAQGLLSKVASTVAPLFDTALTRELRKTVNLLSQFEQNLKTTTRYNRQELRKQYTDYSTILHANANVNVLQYLKQHAPVTVIASLAYIKAYQFLALCSASMAPLLALSLIAAPLLMRRFDSHQKFFSYLEQSRLGGIMPIIPVANLLSTLTTEPSLRKQGLKAFNKLSDLAHKELKIIEYTNDKHHRAMFVETARHLDLNTVPTHLYSADPVTTQNAVVTKPFYTVPLLFESQNGKKTLLNYSKGEYNSATDQMRLIVSNSRTISEIHYSYGSYGRLSMIPKTTGIAMTTNLNGVALDQATQTITFATYPTSFTLLRTSDLWTQYTVNNQIHYFYNRSKDFLWYNEEFYLPVLASSSTSSASWQYKQCTLVSQYCNAAMSHTPYYSWHASSTTNLSFAHKKDGTGLYTIQCTLRNRSDNTLHNICIPLIMSSDIKEEHNPHTLVNFESYVQDPFVNTVHYLYGENGHILVRHDCNTDKIDVYTIDSQGVTAHYDRYTTAAVAYTKKPDIVIKKSFTYDFTPHTVTCTFNHTESNTSSLYTLAQRYDTKGAAYRPCIQLDGKQLKFTKHTFCVEEYNKKKREYSRYTCEDPDYEVVCLYSTPPTPFCRLEYKNKVVCQFTTKDIQQQRRH